MRDSNHDMLSLAGEARRDAMLGAMIGEVIRTRRVRRFRRAAAAAGVGALVFVLAVRLTQPVVNSGAVPGLVDRGNTAADLRDRRKTRIARVVDVHYRRKVFVRVVADNPTVLERFRANPAERVVRLTDQALIETLASIHRPAGLIEVGDRMMLSAPVTDEELNRR